MSKKKDVIEPCPRCRGLHIRKEYQPFQELVGGMKVPLTIHSPPDVFCSCGAALRWTVPLFKTNESGYVLNQIPEGTPLRISSEYEEAHWDDVKVGVFLLVDQKFYGRVTSIDPIGHVFVNEKHFPFTVAHSFKIKKTL